jgi:intein/homing endonuclease
MGIKSVKITPEFARWLGLLCSDGSINKFGRFFKFTNEENILRKEFLHLTKSLFNKIGKEVSTGGRTKEVQVNSTSIVKFLHETFGIPIGRKSNIIKVPPQIIKSSRKVKASFLQGVFDGDGSAFFNKKHHIRTIELTSGSMEFLSQIQSLLKEFGINSWIKNKERKLVISNKDGIKKFFIFINFKHPHRRKKLLQMCNF